MTRLQLVVMTLATMITGSAIADEPRPIRPEPRRPPPSGGPRNKADMDILLGDPGPRRPMPPPAQPYRPPTALVLHGKELMGTWQCKGVQLKADGSSSPFVATITSKPDLGAAWVQSSLVEKPGGSNAKRVDYRTYDETSKQWTRFLLASSSAHVTSTSLGEKAGIWTWTGTETSPTGTLQTRDFEQRADAASYKLWGEALLGGTWQKLYELSCKK